MKAEDIVKRLIDEKAINGEEAIILITAIKKPKETISYPITIPDIEWKHNWGDNPPVYCEGTRTTDGKNLTQKFTTISYTR